MYRINQISNHFNYDENVIVITFYTQNENGELYRKIISNDKSDSEMKDFIRPWSLTTLSINTDKLDQELFNIFGKTFKRCYVRYRNIKTSYDLSKKFISIDSQIEVSLTDDFSSPRYFDTHFAYPISRTSEYEKHLSLESLTGYKKV